MLAGGSVPEMSADMVAESYRDAGRNENPCAMAV